MFAAVAVPTPPFRFDLFHYSDPLIPELGSKRVMLSYPRDSTLEKRNAERRILENLLSVRLKLCMCLCEIADAKFEEVLDVGKAIASAADTVKCRTQTMEFETFLAVFLRTFSPFVIFAEEPIEGVQGDRRKIDDGEVGKGT